MIAVRAALKAISRLGFGYPDEIGGMAPSSASYPNMARFAWLAFAFALIALAVRVASFTLGDWLIDRSLKLSLTADPTETLARVALARRLFGADPSRLEDVAAEARQALLDNPVSPGALGLLAEVDAARGEDEGAATLMQLASRADLRDINSEVWLLDRAVRAGDVHEALRRLDLLLRGQGWRVVDPLAAALATILVDDAYRNAFVAQIAQNPPWRSVFLRQIVAQSPDLTKLELLFEDLQTSAAAPTNDELRPLLNRLVEAELYSDAHRVWLNALTAGERNGAEGFYNRRFDFSLTRLPFDWILTPEPKVALSVETEGEARVLNVDFLGGRVDFHNVSHLLALAPDSYRFSGLEQSKELVNERGLRWRISCASKAATPLGQSTLLKGDTSWREFSIDFVVPAEGCPYQSLVLELSAEVALETEISGRASYRDFDIKPR